MNYYNEHDKNAAAWIEELVANDDLPPGIVDSRDVQAVNADDLLHQYDQCHFFAGIGGWPHALDLAGWPRDKPIWSASLPCQPWSDAGKQLGVKDERHLWPIFRELVAHYRPQYVIGEQVASKAGRAWFAALQLEMEELGYWCGAIDLCAAGFGAPHIRQRLFWCALRMADRNSEGLEKLRKQPARGDLTAAERGGEVGGLPDTETGRRGEVGQIPGGRTEGGAAQGVQRSGHGGSDERLANSHGERLPQRQERNGRANEPGQQAPPRHDTLRCGTDEWIPDTVLDGLDWCREAGQGRRSELTDDSSGNGYWDSVVYLPCSDGKARPIKSRSESVVDGLPGILVPSCYPCAPRVAFPPLVTQQTGDLNNTNEARATRLRGYGNAIVAPLAAEFIRAFMDILDDIGA